MWWFHTWIVIIFDIAITHTINFLFLAITGKEWKARLEERARFPTTLMGQEMPESGLLFSMISGMGREKTAAAASAYSNCHLKSDATTYTPYVGRYLRSGQV